MIIVRMWSMRLSPYAGKARAAFAEKGVDVDLVDIDPRNRPPRLRELNPAGRVPTLELEGDVGIPESSVICEWLEENYPSPALWPEDANLRNWGRAWLHYLDEFVTGPFFRGMRELSFGKPDDPAAVNAQIADELGRAWPALERGLSVHDGPWLCGEAFTYADLGALAVAVRLPQWRPDLVPHGSPLVSAWLEALRDRPTASAIDQKAPIRSDALA